MTVTGGMSNDDAVRADREFASRFFSRLAAPDDKGCRRWTGRLTKPDHHGSGGGYGLVDLPMRLVRLLGKKQLLAHRIAWVLAGNSTPLGRWRILHSCDVRDCCNHDHFHKGTCLQNSAEMMSRGRHRTGRRPRGPEHHNSKLTPEEVATIRSQPGVSGQKLGAVLGVNASTINRARCGETWA